METQIKVDDTRMHNRKNAFCKVAEAELILIESYSGAGSWIEVDGRLKKPVLISKTEKIEVNDWVLLLDSFGNPFLQPQQYKGEGVISKDHRKILALPEHFSAKQLEIITSGKLKHGDIVLIECESKRQGGVYDTQTWTDQVVKFNTLNFITLYKVEDKTFTKRDIPFDAISAVLDYCEEKQIYDKLGSHNDFYYKLKKFFDENKR